MRTVLSPRRPWWCGGVKPIEDQGSRQLGLEGQRFLVFDSESSKCTVDHWEGEQVKERWENDKEVTKFFTIISMGDGKKGLKLLVHWKKELETRAEPTAAPGPAPAQSRATTNMPTTLILTCWTIVAVPGWVLYSARRCCSGAPCLIQQVFTVGCLTPPAAHLLTASGGR